MIIHYLIGDKDSPFKRAERIALVLLLAAVAICLVLGVRALCLALPLPGRWLASAGLLLTIAGVVQLDIGGLFAKVFDTYLNGAEFPNGPPSWVTRDIIDNPDKPVAMQVRTVLLYNLRTGFWFIIVGTAIQVAAVWL